MPQFFFDTHENDRSTRDAEGHPLLDHHAAREEALRRLPFAARTAFRDGDTPRLTLSVRDEAGTVIFAGTTHRSEFWPGSA